jgi:hypothetical protein
MRPPRLPLRRTFSSTQAPSEQQRLSFGFSGAGFLGCYHVGVAACLRRHGVLPHPDECNDVRTNYPVLTGVSAGSMIAAAALAGVNPDPDGMEVVLEASRRTRELRREKRQHDKEGKKTSPSFAINIPTSFDVLTPGFSLIDQVEVPFRNALAKAFGGYCQWDQSNNSASFHDIDPDLFSRRIPSGKLRIGLTDRRGLWPPPLVPFSMQQRRQFMEAYRYVDTYRNLEDIIACSMLSSYIPGITGPFNLKDRIPAIIGGLLNEEIIGAKANTTGKPRRNDASYRAGLRLNEMTRLGLVKHGRTGQPTIVNGAPDDAHDDEPTIYWDGGIADVFPTIDEHTVVVAPVNGFFDPNPSICPQMPDNDSDSGSATECDGGGFDSDTRKHSISTPSSNVAILQNFLRPLLPTTFRHCDKSQLGLNTKNLHAALQMLFSSDDDELYTKFREGYDDAQ